MPFLGLFLSKENILSGSQPECVPRLAPKSWLFAGLNPSPCTDPHNGLFFGAFAFLSHSGCSGSLYETKPSSKHSLWLRGKGTPGPPQPDLKRNDLEAETAEATIELGEEEKENCESV